MRTLAVAALAALLILQVLQVSHASTAETSGALSTRDTAGERGVVSTLRCLVKLFTVTGEDVRNMLKLLFQVCPSGELGPLPVCLLKVAVVLVLGYGNGIIMCLRGWQP